MKSRNLRPDEDNPRTKYVIPSTSFEPTLELPSIFRTPNTDDDEDGPPPPVPPKSGSISKTPTHLSKWNAPSSWEIVQSQVEIRKILDSDSSLDNSHDEKRESLFVGTHFQRFVRRMESAGPRIILERLKEEWDLPGDRAMSDELQLEKQLWTLTAIQLQSMDRFTRPSQFSAPNAALPSLSVNRRRKILELDGSLGE